MLQIDLDNNITSFSTNKIAFPDNDGTADMIKISREAGVTVYEVVPK